MDAASRRELLKSYIASLTNGRADFIAKTGYSKGRVTQLLHKDEPFGEAAAREVARRCGLPKEYFNQVRAPGALSADQSALVEAFNGLLPEQQAQILRDLQTKAAENRRAFEVLKQRFGVNGVKSDGEVEPHVGKPPRSKQKATPPPHVKVTRKK